MKRCRTRFAPRMLAQCAACGEQRSVPHSCGHRACPHCQHHDSQVWLQRQLQSLVPATYFLVTFTLPAELRGLAWSHQRVGLCAADAVRLGHAGHLQPQRPASCAPRPARWACCTPTTGALDFHPHVHMVMPAAALDTSAGCGAPRRVAPAARTAGATRRAHAHARRRLPVQPQGAGQGLPRQGARRHRARRPDAARQAARAWVVDCKCVGDGSKALLYLGRYLYRGVIQEPTSCAATTTATSPSATATPRPARSAAAHAASGADFLWLVLQHVLPKGLRRSRNFGFLHPNSAAAIRLLQVLHLRAAPPAASARRRSGPPGGAPAASPCACCAGACRR